MTRKTNPKMIGRLDCMSGFLQSQRRVAAGGRNFVLTRLRGSREEKDVGSSYIVTTGLARNRHRLDAYS
jgi:hypothetical protein